ncbi:unnamed protein product [Sphagnum jensenii]|uniref:Tr-type G domain-containing protein n=1 Tax=Sphagnum jensenii TaxID=128206 RepID=A0ABP1C118_9BRYO
MPGLRIPYTEKVYPYVDDSPHSNFDTGKTTYLKWMLTGEFEKKYEPTMGKHEHVLEVPTKQGSTQFLCVDTPGHEKPGFPRDKYYEGADCAIIFCDITAKQTQKDVSMWHEDLHK